MKREANTFSIFYVILAVSTLLLLVLIYVKYSDEKVQILQQEKLEVSLIAKTLHVHLLHYESILELLGRQLLENKNYKNHKKSKKILQALLQLNSEIVGFGLVDINGDYLAISANLNVEKMSNLKINKVTRISFEEALNSDTMVIGRTYYLKATNTWIIPIRKTLRNADGTIIGVMTAGLKIYQGNSFLESLKLSKKENNFIVMVKDFNVEHEMYRIYYAPQGRRSFTDLYNKTIPVKVYKNVEKSLKKMYNISIDDLRKDKKVISKAYSFIAKNIQDVTMFSGIVYDKRYKIFIINQNSMLTIYKHVLSYIWIYFLIYLLSQIIFFIFFRYVEKMQTFQKNRLKFQATHDVLTKLPNRQYMYDHLKNFQATRETFELLYIDLDNFKNINDTFGHTIGDEILKKVAHRLKKWIEKKDMLIRQGGDEFIIIKDIENDVSGKYYDNIIEDIGSIYNVEGMDFSIGASIGIARYPEDADDVTTLLSLADMSMYEAKKQKNSFCIYSNKFKYVQNRKVAIDQELKVALQNSEFYMVYQPQINRNGTLYGVEALVRWENKKLGLVGPDEFISVAEESNFIIALSRFITKESAREIDEIQKKLDLEFHLSINLSVKQLFSENFIENLLNDLKVFEEKYHWITLEITERLFIEDIENILPILNRLKENGLELSLDDFGTGYSSLSILRSLPINELKIDKSFVDEILTDMDACILSESIIQMGQNLSMKTLAEGVETEAQVDLLKFQKCDIFQGYYFSKPLSKTNLITFIKNQTS